jgi:hypothetical protein
VTLIDDLIPVVDETRELIADLGLRRYSVALRLRTWDGGALGRGTATDVDTDVEPTPRVRPPSPHRIATSGGAVLDGDRVVDRISATYDEDDLTGGALAAGEEFSWLIDGNPYSLINQPEKQTFGWKVLLRRKNR